MASRRKPPAVQALHGDRKHRSTGQQLVPSAQEVLPPRPGR